MLPLSCLARLEGMGARGTSGRAFRRHTKEAHLVHTGRCQEEAPTELALFLPFRVLSLSPDPLLVGAEEGTKNIF